MQSVGVCSRGWRQVFLVALSVTCYFRSSAAFSPFSTSASTHKRASQTILHDLQEQFVVDIKNSKHDTLGSNECYEAVEMSGDTMDPTAVKNGRRELLQQATRMASGLAMLGWTDIAFPTSANADTGAAPSAADLFLRLKSIPTFCLVDENGIPFMIFDGQASATGFFFLSLDLAARALEDAKAKDKADGANAIWSKAQIVVVPLAVAMQLTLRKTQREAVNNGIKFNTFNDIVPSAEGVEDAKRMVSNPSQWDQKGRVPLFYIPGLTLPDGREPRYFNRIDLVREWRNQHPGEAIPNNIQVVEMVDLYRSALNSNNLSKISNLAIVPVPEFNQMATKLIQSSDPKTLPKYNFNKVFLVGSASS